MKSPQGEWQFVSCHQTSEKTNEGPGATLYLWWQCATLSSWESPRWQGATSCPSWASPRGRTVEVTRVSVRSHGWVSSTAQSLGKFVITLSTTSHPRSSSFLLTRCSENPSPRAGCASTSSRMQGQQTLRHTRVSYIFSCAFLKMLSPNMNPKILEMTP